MKISLRGNTCRPSCPRQDGEGNIGMHFPVILDCKHHQSRIFHSNLQGSIFLPHRVKIDGIEEQNIPAAPSLEHLVVHDILAFEGAGVGHLCCHSRKEAGTSRGRILETHTDRPELQPIAVGLDCWKGIKTSAAGNVIGSIMKRLQPRPP